MTTTVMALLTAGLLAGGASAHLTGDPAREECLMVLPAPTQAVCTTGVHSRGASLTHGFSGIDYSGYTGTLESRVEHDGGERLFRCTINAGTLVSCAGSGTWPAVNARFTHWCESYNLGTTEPGGEGMWGCHVTHAPGSLP